MFLHTYMQWYNSLHMFLILFTRANRIRREKNHKLQFKNHIYIQKNKKKTQHSSCHHVTILCGSGVAPSASVYVHF